MTSNNCTFAISSVTYAIKAQNYLKEHRINARVVRLLPGQAPGGCAYGIELDCRASRRAASILTEAGITANQLPS